MLKSFLTDKGNWWWKEGCSISTDNTDTVRRVVRTKQIQLLTSLSVFAINSCASSSYLTLKNFILPPLKACLEKPLTFANAHTLLQMMTKQLLTTQESHYFLTISQLGLRETVGYSIPWWKCAMEQRFVS